MEGLIFFDWDIWLPRIKKAAEQNEALEIQLPKREWEKLKKENLISLKEKLPENVVGRLILIKEDVFRKGPYLLVARYCACPIPNVVIFR